MRPVLVDLVLLAAVVIDVLLAAMTFLSPGTWFELLHGTGPESPLAVAFLQRCGANWAAFALFQALALLWWRRAPAWLVLVAGIRFSDIFTDWTYLASSTEVTQLAVPSLVLPGFLNLGTGLFLVLAWSRADAMLGRGNAAPS